jgi:hypothetical protein
LTLASFNLSPVAAKSRPWSCRCRCEIKTLELSCRGPPPLTAWGLGREPTLPVVATRRPTGAVDPR